MRSKEIEVEQAIKGIHHITAIAGPAQANLDFYTGVLGLRLVKKTVNFDDPGTYHFYYGNSEGRPGSILTFFPWAHARPGEAGAGMVDASAFSVPHGSIDFWMHRLIDAGVDQFAEESRFDSRVLTLRDPDGLGLELVESIVANESRQGWSAIEPSFAVQGFDGATLLASKPERTGSLLTDVFGYDFVAEERGRFRFQSPDSTQGGTIDIVRSDKLAKPGKGTTHHIAFRARDDEQQLVLREAVVDAGLYVTEVKDRLYFKSVYFREPNGVLFEIATDSPGFATDEPADGLGEHLMLPPWLESRRPDIESRLPKLIRPDLRRTEKTST